ncbi:MAG TPA: neutral/alkaline non-lysosomal ceramidase N-terminal domain-containing protein [Candidatus Hydrogenedentes bacterium]|nr:neutral/alkaline non-lysosomal ceramidase N-terminal domain-containing protein [Candidatus Hydrogenedentota bacterium]
MKLSYCTALAYQVLRLFLLVALAHLPAAIADPLMAGVATTSITPDTAALHVPLGGYGERQNKPAIGVHDNILSKALVLQQGNRKFALVATDLLGIPRSLRDEVLSRIKDSGFASENLMLTASHSHGATEMAAMNRNNVFENKAIGIFDEKLLLFTAEQIANSVVAANASLHPVTVSTGATQLDGLNRNRRGSPVIDRELTVTRLDKADGAPLAILVNWTAHPTFSNANTMVVTADWPGYLQREIEGFIPGTTCLYMNGAEGDISTAGAQGPSEFARAEDYGRKLAVKVLELTKNIPADISQTLDFSMTTLNLPDHAVPKSLQDAAGPEYGLTPENLPVLLEAISPKSSYLGVLRLGDLVAVSIPGEMAASLGIEIKNALRDSGAKYPVIAGLANEWISYMLPPDEYHKGGYEPGVSFYGEQLGPVVVAQAIEAGKALLKK